MPFMFPQHTRTVTHRESLAAKRKSRRTEGFHLVVRSGRPNDGIDQFLVAQSCHLDITHLLGVLWLLLLLQLTVAAMRPLGPVIVAFWVPRVLGRHGIVGIGSLFVVRCSGRVPGRSGGSHVHFAIGVGVFQVRAFFEERRRAVARFLLF